MSSTTIIIVLCVCFVCISSILAMYLYPLPTQQSGPYIGFTQLAAGRIPLNITTAFDATSSDDTLCSLQCADDFTCNGFAMWKEDTKTMCEKFTSVNPWKSISQFFMNKTDGKIFSKNL